MFSNPHFVSKCFLILKIGHKWLKYYLDTTLLDMVGGLCQPGRSGNVLFLAKKERKK
jgi:hypothetical protein